MKRNKVLEISGVAEAAKILDIQKKNISHVRKTKGFPDPVAELDCGSIWLTEELINFKEKRNSKKMKRIGEE